MIQSHASKKILVIGGPTGVGESTISNKIIGRYPVFTRLVTATSRSPRLKERHGRDYYFFTKERFLEELEKGNLLEHTYIEKRDVYYGGYKPDLEKKLAQGRKIIVNPDIVGAKYYKEYYNATTIFIMPDSFDNLRKRLLGRDPDIASAELDKRLDYARYEIAEESSFYDYHVINAEGGIEKTVDEVAEIMQKEDYLD